MNDLVQDLVSFVLGEDLMSHGLNVGDEVILFEAGKRGRIIDLRTEFAVRRNGERGPLDILTVDCDDGTAVDIPARRVLPANVKFSKASGSPVSDVALSPVGGLYEWLRDVPQDVPAGFAAKLCPPPNGYFGVGPEWGSITQELLEGAGCVCAVDDDTRKLIESFSQGDGSP